MQKRKLFGHLSVHPFKLSQIFVQSDLEYKSFSKTCNDLKFLNTSMLLKILLDIDVSVFKKTKCFLFNKAADIFLIYFYGCFSCFLEK